MFNFPDGVRYFDTNPMSPFCKDIDTNEQKAVLVEHFDFVNAIGIEKINELLGTHFFDYEDGNGELLAKAIYDAANNALEVELDKSPLA